MNKLFAEILGWYGAFTIILAYVLVSFAFIGTGSIIYQILNFTGAIGIVIISLAKRAYQPATINVIWTVIALIALLRIIF